MTKRDALRVCILVNNDIVRDGRILKKARSLSEAGMQVLVVGEGETKDPHLDHEPFEIALAYRSVKPIVAPHDRGLKANALRTARSVYRRFSVLQRLRRRVVEENFLNEGMIDPAVQFKPDVVEANDVFTGEAALAIVERTGCLLTYDSHELFEGYFTGHRNNTHAQRKSDEIEARLLARAERVFTPSEQIANHLRCAHPGHDPIVLLNSLPFEEREVEKVHQPVRLLDQTSVREFNNHEAVIEAIALLKGKATYTIQGQCLDPLYRARLFKLIDSLDLGDAVFLDDPFTPDEAITRASSYDIGLASYPFEVPSKNLTLANRVFTYLNAGLAIAVCASSANTALPGFNEYGAVLDIASPETIAHSLAPLIDDPVLIAQKKERAYAWAREFSWEHQAKKYIDAYGTLVT